MARNRRAQAAAVRFGPLVKVIALCLLVAGAGVGYVWQKDQIDQLSRQYKKREMRLRELADQNENLRKQLSRMRSPPFLEQRIKELNLGLVPPQPSQLLRLTEPEAESAPPGPERQYALRLEQEPGRR